MVFGHVKGDDETTLRLACEFTQDMVDKYGAIPRPHVAKNFVPGNDGWRDKNNSNAIEILLKHPEAFQSLDFTALPSTLTHPDSNLRQLATKYFLEMCGIKGNTTKPVLPITANLTADQIEEVRIFNMRKYDR